MVDRSIRRTVRRTSRRPNPITFFDDGVRILSGSGSNNYDADEWIGQLRAFGDLRTDGGPTGSMQTREVFLKLSRPVNEIAFVCIPLGIPVTFSAINSTLEFGDSTGSIRFRIGVNLIKVPLDLGQPFGLDALTGINAEWHRNSTAHGTLYQTAENFESFNNRGALMDSVSADITVFDIIGGATRISGVGGWGGDSGVVETVLATSFSPNQTDGPYFGVHIFMQDSNFSGFDELFFCDRDVDWDFNSEVLSPRVATPGLSHRAFVTGNIFQ